MKLIITYFILLIEVASYTIAQNPYHITSTLDDGLPNNEVYDLEINDNGLINFSTDREVSSYDSYSFKKITTYDGLTDTVNFEIFKDSQGTLRFFGYNGNVT